MNLSESINNATKKGDIKGIRIMMKNSLLVDPTFREFSEIESLTRGVIGLYDTFDGRVLETDKTLWNDDYMNKLMVQVVGNFSTERIAHLKEVVQYLRPMPKDKLKVIAHQNSSRENNIEENKSVYKTYQEQKRDDERNNRIIYKRSTKIVAGAVVGGTVGGAAAALIGGSVFVGAVLGSVTVGVAVAVYTNEGKR